MENSCHPLAGADPGPLRLESIIAASLTRQDFAQPDVTLLLDAEGVIREVSLSEALAKEKLEAWVGRSWIDTVGVRAGARVQDALGQERASRVSVFNEVAQRFPSGLVLLMEYTTVNMGDRAGVIAIGRNLQKVAGLQAQLAPALRGSPPGGGHDDGVPVDELNDRLASVLESLAAQIGKSSMPKLVKQTVGAVEKHMVQVALELTGWNRTAAAQLLGLSRQSLYAKLNRYRLGRDARIASEEND